MSKGEAGVDGRALRRQKSKQALIAAAARLVLDLGSFPTAQQVADEAGVTIRTLFRHFPEMDVLYREVHLVTIASFAKTYNSARRDGTLEERLRSVLLTFSAAYKKQQNLILVTKALMLQSEFLRTNYKKLQKALVPKLLESIPELDRLSRDDKEMVVGLLSFEFWNRLVNVQGLSQKRYLEKTQALVATMIGESI
ncbi:MAG: TetR/AcrR family transcriptional regulator [Cellvibrionaceae bacterium]